MRALPKPLSEKFMRSVVSLAGRDVADIHDEMMAGDRRFVADLTEAISDLPTIRAAYADLPELEEIAVHPVYAPGGGLGYYSSRRGIEINFAFRAETSREKAFDIQLATLPHELRHGYHDHLNCMHAATDPRLGGQLEDMILQDRCAEADATVFSIASIYELYLDGRPGPLRRAADVHPDSVAAYYASVLEDEAAHWDGRAAQAAFEAYFTPGNAARLERYDLKLCRAFAKNLPLDPYREPLPEKAHKDILYNYLCPIAAMPYADSRGRMIDRPHYRPLECRAIMDFVSPRVARCIDAARVGQEFSIPPQRP